jgi:hypothetical protein
MPFLAYLLITLVVAIAVYASMPKPPSNAPQELTDSGVPLASDGRDMCVVFGEVWIDDNNVCNYGALYTVAIKSSGGGK